MSLTMRVGLLAGTAALSLTSGSLAGTGADSDKNLEKRLAAAEARIAELTSATQANWLTEQRTDEIRGIVQDVLADADTRSSLLSQGITAGYDNGAVLGSSDGNWLLRTNILMQQRFIYNNASKASAAKSTGGPGQGGSSGDENRSGFENTRTKFILSGHVVNPDWTYKIDINVGSNGFEDDDDDNDFDRVGTGNAWLRYDYGNGWSTTMGSMKGNLVREDIVEAQNQLAVERSLTSYFFTAGYVDGINFGYETDTWHFNAAYSDGIDSGQTPWADYDTEYAFTIRNEFLISGNWSQFDDLTSPRGSEVGFMIGVGVHFQEGEYGTATSAATPAETETQIVTIDASYEADGWNLFGAFYYMDLDDDTSGAGSIDGSPIGFVVQGGFYLNDDWEIYGRYEYLDYDDYNNPAPGATKIEDLGIFTVGVNRYFASHNAKWTTDLVWGIDPIDGGGFGVGEGQANLTGLRTDDGDEDGQFSIRTQFQIFF